MAACAKTATKFQYPVFRSGLAEVLAAAGELDDSLAVADEALRRAERADAFWWLPEALRIKAKSCSCRIRRTRLQRRTISAGQSSWRIGGGRCLGSCALQ
jgi:hypothetical protein